MAGEVVAVGEDVKQWKSGDRVCANFATEHLDGDITPEIQATALAGNVHGVLQQYKAFITGYVFSLESFFSHFCDTTIIHDRLLLPFRSICLTKRRQLCREWAQILHSTPHQLSLSSCAGVTAYNALLGPVPLKAGDTVLVLGTGGVSMQVHSVTKYLPTANVVSLQLWFADCSRLWRSCHCHFVF